MSRVMNSRLGISAVSLRVVDATAVYAETKRVPLMVIASRNQVEDDGLGSGYCGLTRRELVERVRSQSPTYTFVCRDHGGPYLADADAGLPRAVAADRARESLRRDVDAGFDLLHVDWSRSGGDIVAEARERIPELLDRAGTRKPAFEVSVATVDGGVDDPRRFAKTFEQLADLAPAIEFASGRTGSLVRGMYQSGSFDYTCATRIAAIAHELGMRFKEHNVDYSACSEVRVRTYAGVDAINIGPELAVLETRVLARLAALHGASVELDALFAAASASGRWRKWTSETSQPRTRALLAAHYCHGTDEYEALIKKLGECVDVDGEVLAQLCMRIDAYVRCLHPSD